MRTEFAGPADQVLHTTLIHATFDLPQISRHAGSLAFAGRLWGEFAGWVAAIRCDTKHRRSNAEARDGATWLSCRKVRVPNDRPEHAMLPTQAIHVPRHGQFQRSHHCVGAQAEPRAPYAVSELGSPPLQGLRVGYLRSACRPRFRGISRLRHLSQVGAQKLTGAAGAEGGSKPAPHRL